jgi:hypothetical protein
VGNLGRLGRQPRPNAIAIVSPVPKNSHGAEVASVTRIPSATAKPPDAMSTWANTSAARKLSGGLTTTARSPPGRV